MRQLGARSACRTGALAIFGLNVALPERATGYGIELNKHKHHRRQCTAATLGIAGLLCFFTSVRLMQYRYHSLQTRNSFTNVHSSWRDNLRWTLELWMTFMRDERLCSRRYLRMICVRKAVMIIGERLRRRDWTGIQGDVVQFFRLGLLDPRTIYYHLVYFLRFRRLRMGRLVP